MRVLMLVCRVPLATSPLQPTRYAFNNLPSCRAALSRPTAPKISVVTFNELVDAVAAAMGRRRIRLHAPLWLCRIAAAAAERLKPGSFLSKDAIVGLTQDATLDHSDLVNEFGWKPLDLASGLALYFGGAADADASREAA